jgi:hypothetical protein
LALHEIIHELKARNLSAVILKLDFEKAYDRVNWAFLREVLTRKGFDPALVHRFMNWSPEGKRPSPSMGKPVLSSETNEGCARVIHSPHSYLSM